MTLNSNESAISQPLLQHALCSSRPSFPQRWRFSIRCLLTYRKKKVRVTAARNENRRLRERRTYLGARIKNDVCRRARMKNDVSRREDEERRISPQTGHALSVKALRYVFLDSCAEIRSSSSQPSKCARKLLCTFYCLKLIRPIRERKDFKAEVTRCRICISCRTAAMKKHKFATTRCQLRDSRGYRKTQPANRKRETPKRFHIKATSLQRIISEITQPASKTVNQHGRAATVFGFLTCLNNNQYVKTSQQNYCLIFFNVNINKIKKRKMMSALLISHKIF